MTVQVSTQIDMAMKQQFDKICEAIGISPSDALSMFISDVIHRNAIPFNMVIPPEKPSKLPFGRGCMKGKMWMADDFDAPLEDFQEYME